MYCPLFVSSLTNLTCCLVSNAWFLGAYKLRAQVFLGTTDPAKLHDLYTELVDLFLSDVPWGIIKGLLHDIKFLQGDITKLVEWMASLLRDTGRIIIAVGSDAGHLAQWVGAMTAAGLYTEVIIVISSDQHNTRRCATFSNRPNLTGLTTFWVMGRKKYTGSYHSQAPFGMFVLFIVCVLFYARMHASLWR